MQTCNLLRMHSKSLKLAGSVSNNTKYLSYSNLRRERYHQCRIQAVTGDADEFATVGQEWAPHTDDDDPYGVEGGIGWIVDQSSYLTKQAEEEAAEDFITKSTGGIHIRGNMVSQASMSTDESDEKRVPWHRNLHACVMHGDPAEAASILKQMREAGHPPGPKAYHALIFAFVKSQDAAGALNAIRAESDADIKPLPQSYAAVIQAFLNQGDLETAVAVYESNRRAGVSYEKSWAAICTALFKAEDYNRALRLVAQGEAEGLVPDGRLYEGIIQSFARQGDLTAALSTLKEMSGKGLCPTKDHFSALVTGHALNGKTKEAEALLTLMLKAPGSTSAATIGAINALLQMYLEQNLPHDELAGKISALRKLMIRGGMALDRKGCSLLLEASVYLKDPQIGMLSIQTLRSHGRGSLQYVTDDILGHFLLELSLNRQPADIYNVLTVMSCDQRMLTEDAMLTTENGRTFLSEWIAPYADAGEESSGEVECLDIDGVQIDPVSLCAVGADHTPLRPTKMSVKELRAELAARQYPFQGNKNTLVKQLQKARSDAENPGSDDGSKLSKKKTEIIISEHSWDTGNLMASNIKTADKEALEDDDFDDTTDDIEDDDEDEEEEISLATWNDDDEEDDFDYEDRVSAVMAAAGKFNTGTIPRFLNSRAGLDEALTIVNGVIAMGGMPTKADISTLAHVILSGIPENAETHAKGLLTIVDSVLNASDLLEEDLRQQLAVLVQDDSPE